MALALSSLASSAARRSATMPSTSSAESTLVSAPSFQSAEEEATGNRHPEDADRVACRKHVREAVLKKAGSLKGKQLFPHEIVRTVTANRNASTLEDDVANAQWAAIAEALDN